MPIPATIIDYLDDHSGAFTALLTFALIAITAFYAWQNRRVVSEMALARRQAVLPKLAVEFHRLAPNVMTTAVKNVGPGAAVAVDVILVFEPAGSAERLERRWRMNLVAPGDQQDFMLGPPLQGNVRTLPAAYRAIRLVGTMRDVLGHEHEVDEAFEDLAEWQELGQEGDERWVHPDPEHRFAYALHTKFKEPLQSLSRDLQRIARAVRESGGDDNA